MTRLTGICVAVILLRSLAPGPSAQTVYPTGTTIYDPERAWGGFTVLSPLGTQAVLVIDMNGAVVKRWDGFNNSAGGPARVLPGGSVIAASGARPPHQESLELVHRDFDGKMLWQFSRGEQITTREGTTVWSARQHHDWQRTDFPAGYYSPDYTPGVAAGTTLITAGAGGRLFEVTRDGAIVWEFRVQ
jgi:hypothetical protein